MSTSIINEYGLHAPTSILINLLKYMTKFKLMKWKAKWSYHRRKKMKKIKKWKLKKVTHIYIYISFRHWFEQSHSHKKKERLWDYYNVLSAKYTVAICKEEHIHTMLHFSYNKLKIQISEVTHLLPPSLFCNISMVQPHRSCIYTHFPFLSFPLLTQGLLEVPKIYFWEGLHDEIYSVR